MGERAGQGCSALQADTLVLAQHHSLIRRIAVVRWIKYRPFMLKKPGYCCHIVVTFEQ